MLITYITLYANFLYLSRLEGMIVTLCPIPPRPRKKTGYDKNKTLTFVLNMVACMTYYTHFSNCFNLIWVVVDMEPIPEMLGVRQEYTQYRCN